ncbi:MAG: pyruvate dehydrogenase (acetyl-transferring) E1 component subunit alpha [Nitrospirae bacterium]|nr:pyruvate dehydrogenase (acetyl-transferring) E1 component subunit alpha [Nitrospirota bacterium]
MYFDRYDPFKGEKLEIMDKDGRIIDASLMPDITDERIKELYVRMSVMRVADKTALNLQREGRMGTYAPVLGQEAAQACSAALGKDDWLVPSYRETGAMFMKGVPLAGIYRYWMGDERGMSYGKELRVLPIAVVVGSQTLPATGLAWAMKAKGEKSAVLVCFGDGASSEGAVHEAMNIAGVMDAPVVFFCQNNQFAISVPRKRQTAAKTIAQRAAGYGFKGIQIYANDLLAVYGSVKEALDHAKAGNGPSFIEGLTYRFGPHTTADDPTKYRTDEELEKNKPFDPLVRLRLYLNAKGLWSEEEEYAIADAAKAEVEAAVKEAEEAAPAPVTDIFDYTYSSVHPYLKRQRDEMTAFLAEAGKGGV